MPDANERPLELLNLGAGVQSTTLALMAELNLITPRLDGAIFADTGGESRRTYEHLDWLEKQLSYPVYRVMEKEGLTKALLESARTKKTRVGNLPAFAKKDNGKAGKIRRVCTSEYKIVPVERKVRELLGLKRYQHAGKYLRVNQWIGISWDEIQRVRTSPHKWSYLRYPLIEIKMTRQQCLKWMKDRGFPEPPRSACTYCPYHSDYEWQRIKDEEPDSWAEAVHMDRAIRSGLKGTTQTLYLHRSLIPLEDVKFKTEANSDQEFFNFQEECQGMCGN